MTNNTGRGTGRGTGRFTGRQPAKRKKQRPIVVALFAGLLGTIAVDSSSLAASAANRSIMISPATGVTDGQSISVDGAGYASNDCTVLVVAWVRTRE